MKKWLFLSIIMLIGTFSISCGGTTTTENTTQVSTTTDESNNSTENTFTVVFFVNGNEVSSLEVIEGNLLTIPFLENQGYSLDGWYLSNDGGASFSTKWVMTNPVEGDFNIYANWVPNSYVITYDSNGGSTISALTQEYGSEIYQPIPPTKENYTFIGWFADIGLTEEFIFSTMPYENITLYAKWQPNQFQITYRIISDDIDPLNPIVIDTDDYVIDYSLGLFHSATLTAKGRLYTSGYNSSGQLGVGDTDRRLIAEEITDNFEFFEEEIIEKIFLGQNQSSAVTSLGRVFYWGINFSNYDAINLPVDITESFNLETGEEIIQIDFGDTSAIALSSYGRVFTWGINEAGQLGDGTVTANYTPTDITSRFLLAIGEEIIQVEFGYAHAGLLTSLGRVYTWGNNGYGQLGNGLLISSSDPLDITANLGLAVGDQVQIIVLESAFTAVLTDNGELYTWGENRYGQIGDGSNDYKTLPQRITPNLNLNIDEKVILFDASGFHTLAYTNEGRLFSWGYNSDSQLGYFDFVNRNYPDIINQYLDLNPDETITKIILGYKDSAFITSENNVYRWGDNNQGQLNDNSAVDISTPKLLMVDNTGLGFEVRSYYYQETIDLYEPTNTGYLLDGWYYDKELTIPFDLTLMPAEDITLYGRWE
ncbi:MAG: InlB B-repeat-containing protein [Candidatus Izemoplasmatales bacterium]